MSDLVLNIPLLFHSLYPHLWWVSELIDIYYYYKRKKIGAFLMKVDTIVLLGVSLTIVMIILVSSSLESFKYLSRFWYC